MQAFRELQAPPYRPAAVPYVSTSHSGCFTPFFIRVLRIFGLILTLTGVGMIAFLYGKRSSATFKDIVNKPLQISGIILFAIGFILLVISAIPDCIKKACYNEHLYERQLVNIELHPPPPQQPSFSLHQLQSPYSPSFNLHQQDVPGHSYPTQENNLLPPPSYDTVCSVEPDSKPKIPLQYPNGNRSSRDIPPSAPPFSISGDVLNEEFQAK